MMKTHLYKFKNHGIFLLFVFFILNNSSAQSYSIQETVNHINNLLESSTLTYSENKFSIDGGGHWEIYVSDISEVTVGEYTVWGGAGNASNKNFFHSNCVYLNCLYESDCAKIYYKDKGPDGGLPWLSVCALNNSDAEKVANAFRYLIDKVKASTVVDDPFSSYSVKKKNTKTLNIEQLRIGMSKETVFNLINSKPKVESIEKGYEVYKVQMKNQYLDYYFLYFSYNRLVRVDKGESIYNAIIIID